jgi:hypothetical protein
MCWPHVNPVPSGAVGKDCQRRLLSRPRFVRACSATDLFFLLFYFVMCAHAHTHKQTNMYITFKTELVTEIQISLSLLFIHQHATISVNVLCYIVLWHVSAVMAILNHSHAYTVKIKLTIKSKVTNMVAASYSKCFRS